MFRKDMKMKKNLSIRWASFRDFEIIKALIEKGTVTLAAEYLGISQPAVSKSVANIEDKSGKVLFVREKGRLTPTADALFIYEEIKNIFSSLQRIDNNNWFTQPAQTIRVITTPTVAYTFLSRITAKYIKEKSNIKIVFSVVNSVDMCNELREGRADLALGNAEINNSLSELTVQNIFRTKIVCIMHKNHELAKKEKIEVNDFSFRNMIMYTARNILASKIKKELSESGVEINVVAEVSDSMTALNFAKENVGLFLAPYFPVVFQLDDSLIIKEVDMNIYDEMAIFSMSNNLNPYLSDYIEYLSSNINNLTQDMATDL